MITGEKFCEQVLAAGRDFVSLHNHSFYSDGGSSLEEMCRAAKKAGLKVFGISDHLVCRPWNDDEEERWWIEPEKLTEYFEEMLRLKSILEENSFQLKTGLEVDFFYENIDSVLAVLADYPVDYLIGSVHYAGHFPIDYKIDAWMPLSEDEKAEVCRIYWEKLEGAAARKEFAFIGHLDLPKKYALIDNGRYFGNACRVLDILAENGGGFEVNTAGWFKECREQYPASPILKYAAERNVRCIISADAHHHDHVNRSYERAADVIKKAGY